jgi:hypothetical protein
VGVDVRAKVICVGIVTAVLAIGGIAAPADAESAFGRSVRMTPKYCAVTQLASTNSATQRGFTSCGVIGHIRYVWGTGTSWHTTDLHYYGKIVAVTDDGSASYLMYQEGKFTLSLLIRTRSGSIRHETLKRYPSQPLINGAIVARHGSWWADWHDNWSASTWQAHTLNGQQKATRLHLATVSISLTLRGSKPVMAWTGDQSANLYVGRPSGIKTWTRATIVKDTVYDPEILDVNGHLAVAYEAWDSKNIMRPNYAVNGAKGWQKKTLSSTGAPAWDFAAAVHAGVVVVAWRTYYAVQVAKLTKGQWSQRSLGATNVALIDASVSSNGRALIVQGDLSPKHLGSTSRLES